MVHVHHKACKNMFLFVNLLRLLACDLPGGQLASAGWLPPSQSKTKGFLLERRWGFSLVESQALCSQHPKTGFHAAVGLGPMGSQFHFCIFLESKKNLQIRAVLLYYHRRNASLDSYSTLCIARPNYPQNYLQNGSNPAGPLGGLHYKKSTCLSWATSHFDESYASPSQNGKES